MATKKPPKRGATPGPYWLNDVAEFDWEIVRAGKVHAILDKQFEGGDADKPSNRAAALRMVERRNRKWQGKRAKK